MFQKRGGIGISREYKRMVYQTLVEWRRDSRDRRLRIAQPEDAERLGT